MVYLAGLIGPPALGDLAEVTLLDSAAAAGVVSVLTFPHNALKEWRDVAYDRSYLPHPTGAWWVYGRKEGCEL